MQNEQSTPRRLTDFEILDTRMGRIETLLEQVIERLDRVKETPEEQTKVPVLSFIEGSHKGEQVNLSESDEWRIGRKHEHNPEKLDLAIDDATISAEHCLIRRSASGEYVLKDLGSSNGTSVNEKRLKETYTLQDGDCIKIGQIKLRFDRVQLIPSEFPGTEVKERIDD